jgi:hypothetical protein
VDILQEAQDSNALLEDSVGGLMSEMEKLQQERLSILQQAILCCFVSVRCLDDFFECCGWFLNGKMMRFCAELLDFQLPELSIT